MNEPKDIETPTGGKPSDDHRPSPEHKKRESRTMTSLPASDPKLSAIINQSRIATGLFSGATGAMGMIGQAIDIPGFYAAALLNVGRIAKFYGFDPTAEEERNFIVQLLLIGHLPTEEGRIKELTKIHLEPSTRLYAQELGAIVASKGSTLSVYKLASKAFATRFKFMLPVVGAAANLAANVRFMEAILATAIRGYSRRAELKKSVAGSDNIS